MSNTMKKAAVVLNIIIAILVFYAWGRMTLGLDEGTILSAARLASLKYFTVDSNLLAAIAALCILPFEFRDAFRGPGHDRRSGVNRGPGHDRRAGLDRGNVRNGRSQESGIPVWALVLKLTATTAVSLTFLTVMVFLGPMYGYAAMVHGAQLYMHLLVPLLAIFTLCVTERNRVLTLRHTLIAAVPMLVYGTVYLGNILINGREGNDWYAFAQWGIPASFLVYIIIAFITWLLAVLLRAGCRRR